MRLQPSGLVTCSVVRGSGEQGIQPCFALDGWWLDPFARY